MRVLHVISEMGSGGAETLVAGMAMAGGSVGWESAVASGGGHRADALRARGVPTFTVPVARRRAAGVLRAASATRAAVRRFGPDVVLAHNVSATLVARLAVAPGRAVPVVTVCHGLADADYPGAARILRHTARTVIAVAGATAERLRTAGLPDPVVIPNAVFPQQATAGRDTVRAALGIVQDVPVALCVARMEPQKRHDVLLDAWAKLGGDAVLLLAGDGSLRAELAHRCTELALTGRVRFLGTRADVPDLLAAADVTVLTSDWEGMPVAVLESMAAGRPVVATDVSGVRAVLAGGGGIVVPRRDPAATAEALDALLFDPAARDAAAAAGLATIRCGHDPHTFMRSYDELLRAAIRGRRR
ncbi:glycosyltransferase [Actinophytocola algeriensis]|uniref:Glycosyltransferase involved in cell wall biosynthesis n=1 Tax=Actinophytocola algeriensis TaxID=1768010 RepID=A0A7W7Q2R4_9PSEU|nr:glycosyltransferase [Actinophytocola algeriensis]MBB4905945.1 glycosyltransferase involved in cell wall biosynthesis [Actinophytocola algeriensis]MBE1472370.1 glycosyltransferase involved in cell wall biosynthesis [Actinophytocola algeriensis]